MNWYNWQEFEYDFFFQIVPYAEFIATYMKVKIVGIHNRFLLAQAIHATLMTEHAVGALQFTDNVCYLERYRQVSNIRSTKSQYFNDSRTVLQLSLPNPLKPDVKSRMKMQLEQRRQAMLQLHLNDRQFYCLLRFTVDVNETFLIARLICWKYCATSLFLGNLVWTQSRNFVTYTV